MNVACMKPVARATLPRARLAGVPNMARVVFVLSPAGQEKFA